ncbi:MAG: DEAD/DEAH box helicase, partial [Anaerolineae bacterium]|nr:DEAD/DEAH box helicase [Anaerolineae bacterium]
MSLNTLLDELRFDGHFMANVTAWERIPARPAQYAKPPDDLDLRLVDMLCRLGLSSLYTHQSEAVEAALAGQHVVLATGTASGKSLAYHLLALQAILRNPHATALYLFPTKALAQDQDIALSELIETLDPDVPIAHNLY